MSDDRPIAVSERFTRVGQRAGAVAGCGAVAGGVWVTAAGRAQFHRHVVASGLTAGMLAGFYFGVREVLLATSMNDNAPVSALAGFYSSVAVYYSAGLRRSRILPWALVTGASAGAVHLAYDQLHRSKCAYVRALPAGREPSLGDWLSWATAPKSRAEWTHRLGQQLDWLLYGEDILEIRRRVAAQSKERDVGS